MTSSSPCQHLPTVHKFVVAVDLTASRLQPWYTWIESWRLSMDCDCKGRQTALRGWQRLRSGHFRTHVTRQFATVLSMCLRSKTMISQWSYEYHWVSWNLQGCNKTCLIWFVHARACASNRIACRSPWSLGHWCFSTSLTFICILFIEGAETIYFKPFICKIVANLNNILQDIIW